MISLKQRLQEPKIVLAPGVCDGLSALVAEQAGAEALYLSGAAIAYSRFGRPDIGLVSMSEVADTLAIIRDRVECPIVVDGDTGFGNALNVQRTVRVFERAGADAVQLEDQTMPKRCGHLAGKTVVPKAEMVGKVRAALDSRASEEFLIIARTDAVAVEGFDAAIDRASAYADAGADMVFIDALEDIEQMRNAVAALGDRVPVMANMVEGGRTPIHSVAELQEIGFSLAIFPGGVVRAVARTLQDFYGSLVAHGSTEAFRERMLDFEGLNAVIGTAEMIATGQTYDEDAG